MGDIGVVYEYGRAYLYFILHHLDCVSMTALHVLIFFLRICLCVVSYS